MRAHQAAALLALLFAAAAVAAFTVPNDYRFLEGKTLTGTDSNSNTYEIVLFDNVKQNNGGRIYTVGDFTTYTGNGVYTLADGTFCQAANNNAGAARSGSFTLKCGTATTSTLTVTETATCVYDIIYESSGVCPQPGPEVEFAFSMNADSLADAQSKEGTIKTALAGVGGVSENSVTVAIKAASRRLLATGVYKVTITIYGTTSELTVFTSGSASVWARIYSALTAAGISYVPGSLYINGVPMPKESDSVIIGVPIGVSLGVLFLASIVAVRCFQKRKPDASGKPAEDDSTCCSVSYTNFKSPVSPSA